MRILRPVASVLLLSLTLGASTGFAAPAPAVRQQGAAARGDLLDQLRGFLVSLWSPEGCRLDPWGRCMPGATTASPHTLKAPAGCRLDPLGYCLPGARSAVPQPPMPEAGCRLDPLGLCLPQP